MSDLHTSGVTGEELRRTCSAWPTGVTVITSYGTEGQPFGLAVNSFTSLSLDPPLVLFCPANTSSTWPHIARSGRFVVNVLSDHQSGLARRFARSGIDKFAQTAWSEVSGLPRLEGTSATLVCSIEQIHPGGDHEIVVGRVELVERHERPPLVFHDGDMYRLSLQRAS